jgi:hypothetical protein
MNLKATLQSSTYIFVLIENAHVLTIQISVFKITLYLNIFAADSHSKFTNKCSKRGRQACFRENKMREAFRQRGSVHSCVISHDSHIRSVVALC